VVTERVDSVVIGAGVVGLAAARALAQAGREVLVLEAASRFGSVTSARNSEVIHAGIHYPPDSLKARLCMQGREMLYRYCAERGIAHRRCGKLIVATGAAQVDELRAIQQRAAANGILNLCLLTRGEALALEPDLACHAALLSPSTGIIDSHALMSSLLGDAQNAGGVLAVNSRVKSLAVQADSARAAIKGVVGGEGGDTELLARAVVNAAGLHAPWLAAHTRGLAAGDVPTAYFAKGNYFTLSSRAPFSRLIYPLPEPGGLGVHLTLDLGGQARFGPDVQWVESADDYTVDPARGDAFYAEVRKYWPELPDGALQPAYAGIRPKISGPGQPAADFVIQGPCKHGVAGLVNLFGIESPGLTSCLALAENVAEQMLIPSPSRRGAG
jgi:L-2-hydroxyglutarate oxidase LhgO